MNAPAKGGKRIDVGSGALGALRAFREQLYACMQRRADAFFELADAILDAGAVPSPAQLSPSVVHHCGWGGLYAALSKGPVDVESLQDLLARHPLTQSGRCNVPQVYAVDRSTWACCDAETGPERGYYHPSRHSAGRPTVAELASEDLRIGKHIDERDQHAGAAVDPALFERDSETRSSSSVYPASLTAIPGRHTGVPCPGREDLYPRV